MTLSDTINRMLDFKLRSSKWTSASPGKENILKSIEDEESPDLESEIKSIIDDSLSSRSNKKQKDINEKVEEFDDGNVGQIQQMTGQQFGNVQQFARDPFQFIFSGVFKKFAKGAGVIALAAVIFSAVQFIIDELMKPGRHLDRRFKRQIKKELLLFNNAREQAELRQGFRSVIVTTIPLLSGNELRGQISGNLYNPTIIPSNRLDPRRVEPPNPRTQGLNSFGIRRSTRFSR